MENFFKSPFKGIELAQQVTNPNIVVGKHSYYSGYYHEHSFDECARYLAPDRNDVDRLVIGNYCSIGSGAVFMMAGNQGHCVDWAAIYPFHYMEGCEHAADGFARAGDTVIGNDVWVGSEAMIMPGIRVGDGAVIGSRAVVTKDVEPFAIVAGNPARFIRKRFRDHEIELLLEMKWWCWEENEIQKQLALLTSGDIEALHRSWQR